MCVCPCQYFQSDKARVTYPRSPCGHYIQHLLAYHILHHPGPCDPSTCCPYASLCSCAPMRCSGSPGEPLLRSGGGSATYAQQPSPRKTRSLTLSASALRLRCDLEVLQQCGAPRLASRTTAVQSPAQPLGGLPPPRGAWLAAAVCRSVAVMESTLVVVGRPPEGLTLPGLCFLAGAIPLPTLRSVWLQRGLRRLGLADQSAPAGCGSGWQGHHGHK